MMNEINNSLLVSGVRGQHEGLVHISQLHSQDRVTEVSDIVHRGQRVKVKVLSITGNKMSLSIKVRVATPPGESSHAPYSIAQHCLFLNLVKL